MFGKFKIPVVISRATTGTVETHTEQANREIITLKEGMIALDPNLYIICIKCK